MGLDISDRSLKLVALERKIFGGLKKDGRKNQISLAGYNQISVPEGYFEHGEIKEEDKIITLIRKLIRETQGKKITNKLVISVLPETSSFIKQIEIAATPTDKIGESVREEVKNHIPFPLEDVYLDWQKISQANGNIEILISAAPKRIVDSYTRLLIKADLKPVALEIESVAITRCLLKEGDESNAVQIIIDLGASRTSLIFWHKNKILFTNSIPFAGERITLEIAEKLKLTREQAERAKIVCGFSEKKCHGVLKKILEPNISETIKKINSAIIFYQDHFANPKEIKRVLLCGGGSNFKNISNLLTAKLGIKTEIGDPLINLSQTSKNESFPNFLRGGSRQKIRIIQIPNRELLSYATAIGLALRGLLSDELNQ